MLPLGGGREAHLQVSRSRMQVQHQLFVGVHGRRLLPEYVRMEAAPLLAVVELVAEGEGGLCETVRPAVARSNFQVVDAAERQSDVPTAVRTVQLRCIGNTVRPAEETRFLVGVAQRQFAAVAAPLIHQQCIAAALQPRRVLQPPLADRQTHTEVGEAVGRHAVIRPMPLAVAQTGIPMSALQVAHSRATQTDIDGLATQGNLRPQGVVPGNGGREYLYHPTHGIAAVEHGSRTFDNPHAVHIVGIYLQTMVSTPLLTFLFDVVLRHGYTLEAQTAYHRFAEPHTDVHRLYTGGVRQSTHQAMSCPQVHLVGRHLFCRLGSQYRMLRFAGGGNADFLELNAPDGVFGLCVQRGE